MKEFLKRCVLLFSLAVATHGWGGVEEREFRLPQPSHDGKISVEAAIKSRRTTSTSSSRRSRKPAGAEPGTGRAGRRTVR